MAILDNVKADLGITSNVKDGTLTAAIAAAKTALGIAGVDEVRDADALTVNAIELYCRYWLNYQGDGERYLEAFKQLRNAMALSGRYIERGDIDG